MADVSITATAVAPISNTTYDTQTFDGIAGESITAGQTVYNTSNVLYKADGNASLVASAVAGIALHAATSGQPLRIASGGEYYCGFTATVGGVYINSTTAGGIAPVADLTSDNYTCLIGIARTASIMRIVRATAGVHA